MKPAKKRELELDHDAYLRLVERRWLDYGGDMRANRHTPEHKPRTATYVIPHLRERMAAKQASAQSMADRAGVNRGTVHKARHGGALRAEFASWIEEALERFEYKYIPRGRRYGAPYRGKAHDESGRYRGCLPFV